MPASRDQLFKAGIVTGTHGLRGDLKVRPESSGSDSLENATRVFVRSEDGRDEICETLRVTQHKGLFLVRLRGFESIELAEPLVGSEIWMTLDELAELDEEENYWYQLEGLEVVDARHGNLGKIENLLSTAAHDIYVVNGPFGEVMIPAVEAFVIEVDLECGVMNVDLPDGLVAKNDDL